MKHARPDYERFQDPAGLIPADEPVLLIRGQDKAAPATLRSYVTHARFFGAGEDLLQAVLQQADRMEDWQRQNTSKTPDL